MHVYKLIKDICPPPQKRCLWSICYMLPPRHLFTPTLGVLGPEHKRKLISLPSLSTCDLSLRKTGRII